MTQDWMGPGEAAAALEGIADNPAAQAYTRGYLAGLQHARAPHQDVPPNWRRVRTYYRAVLLDNGRLWCESRASSDVLESIVTAPGPVSTEVCYTYEVDGNWQPWSPPARDPE